MTTRTSPLPALVGVSFVAALAGFVTPACEGGGGEVCNGCDEGQYAYICAVGSSNDKICAWDDAQAAGLCEEGWDSKTYCGGGATEGQHSYPGWDPGSYVSLAQGVYEIDRELIDEIAADANVLLAEDSARLEKQTGGYYKFESIASGDLADVLGFQNNDIVISANGNALPTWDDYLDVIVEDFQETAFSVVVYRNSQYVTLYYRIQ